MLFCRRGGINVEQYRALKAGRSYIKPRLQIGAFMQGRQLLTACVHNYISWLAENRPMVRTTHSIVSLWLLCPASAFQIMWLPTWRCLSILDRSNIFPCFNLASTIMLPPSQCQEVFRLVHGPLGFLITPAELVQIVLLNSVLLQLTLIHLAFPCNTCVSPVDGVLIHIDITCRLAYYSLLNFFALPFEPFCKNERTKERKSGQCVTSVY